MAAVQAVPMWEAARCAVDATARWPVSQREAAARPARLPASPAERAPASATLSEAGRSSFDSSFAWAS
ncbi:hypothetical protein EBN88_29810 [Streptomyces triticirhizae]|uniref:Uncharacterized protein n=1 Tax=Streptomyces triticirhizae TaxID=2483353 RepID=A0A3M2KMT3_9ACTN|nr:hypothetical protein EBN88_29810 [Streptomyces triticirhizae]